MLCVRLSLQIGKFLKNIFFTFKFINKNSLLHIFSANYYFYFYINQDGMGWGIKNKKMGFEMNII